MPAWSSPGACWHCRSKRTSPLRSKTGPRCWNATPWTTSRRAPRGGSPRAGEAPADAQALRTLAHRSPGERSSRSPGDLVLALSDSKGEAACSILAAELEALGERLRAVVVTDFESMSSGARPEEDLRARCRCEDTGVLGVVQIVGEGVDWSPRTYVSLVTDAFEVGLTRCVVGTRGLLGKGWDSPSINVLVDLTSVTTL